MTIDTSKLPQLTERKRIVEIKERMKVLKAECAAVVQAANQAYDAKYNPLHDELEAKLAAEQAACNAAAMLHHEELCELRKEADAIQPRILAYGDPDTCVLSGLPIFDCDEVVRDDDGKGAIKSLIPAWPIETDENGNEDEETETGEAA